MTGFIFKLPHPDALAAAFAFSAAVFADRRATHSRGLRMFVALIHRGLRTVNLWFARAEQRRMLAEFDDHCLQDIGITRAEAEAEIAKPFWR